MQKIIEIQNIPYFLPVVYTWKYVKSARAPLLFFLLQRLRDDFEAS